MAAACAAAGIIGCITVTGLGLKFFTVNYRSLWQTSAIRPAADHVSLSGAWRVPTTAQYIIISTLAAPALMPSGRGSHYCPFIYLLLRLARADITRRSRWQPKGRPESPVQTDENRLCRLSTRTCWLYHTLHVCVWPGTVDYSFFFSL